MAISSIRQPNKPALSELVGIWMVSLILFFAIIGIILLLSIEKFIIAGILFATVITGIIMWVYGVDP